MKKVALVLLFITSIPFFANAANFINRYETNHGFSINLPFGWEEAPDSLMKKYSEFVSISSENSTAKNFDYGYQERAGNNWFAGVPYILIEVNTRERMSETKVKNIDEMVETFEKELEEVNDAYENTIRSSSVGETWYDDEKNILYSLMSADATNGNSLRMMTAILLTSKGSINIYLHSNENEFNGHYELFKDIVANVMLDDEIVFIPHFTDDYPFLLKIKNFKLNKSPYVAIAALIICLALWRSREKF